MLHDWDGNQSRSTGSATGTAYLLRSTFFPRLNNFQSADPGTARIFRHLVGLAVEVGIAIASLSSGQRGARGQTRKPVRSSLITVVSQIKETYPTGNKRGLIHILSLTLGEKIGMKTRSRAA
jgi:hypothetical protein